MIPSRGRLRSLLTLVGVAAFATGWAKADLILFETAAPFLLIGMALHLWSKGHLHQNRILTRTGPYRWVRNPFYLANLLIEAALCAMIGRWEVAAPYLVLWGLVYAKTIRREEGELRALFGAEFDAYRARVPCLLPWRLPLPRDPSAPGFAWSNRNLSEGREVSRLLLIAVRPPLFLLVGRWSGQGRGFLSGWLGWNGVLLASVALLWGMAFVAGLRRKGRARVPSAQ